MSFSNDGVWGIRYRQKDKLTKIENSMPDVFGEQVIKFCKTCNVEEMITIYKRIMFVDSCEIPSIEELKDVKRFIFDAKGKYWLNILEKCENDILYYRDGLKYMIDYNYLIEDSMSCYYGYIINLDKEALEIWKGRQKNPQLMNRYNRNNQLYPCRFICQYPFKKIPKDFKEMESIENIYKKVLGR